MSEHSIQKFNLSSGQNDTIPLNIYCSRLSKMNNSVLFKLERYLQKPLLSDDQLSEIRDIILTVSADISKLNERIVCGDDNERLL